MQKPFKFNAPLCNISFGLKEMESSVCNEINDALNFYDICATGREWFFSSVLIL